MFILNTGFPPEPRWTKFSFQQDISLPELSHKHLWGVGGEFIIKSILESSFFFCVASVLQDATGSRVDMALSEPNNSCLQEEIPQEIALKTCSVLCPNTCQPSWTPLWPELREGIHTELCTHSMRGEVWNQSSLTQTEINNILYFHQPEIYLYHHQ